MSENLVEVDTWAGQVTVPQNGIDLRNAESVRLPFQQLANRTRKDHNDLVDVITYQVQGQRLGYPIVHDPNADEWAVTSNYTTGIRRMVQAVVNSSHPYFWIPIGKLPATWRLNAMSVFLKGASSHSVDDPPAISLVRMWDGVDTVATFVPNTSGGVDDPTDGAYDTWHPLTAQLGNYEIAEDSAYAIRVRGEFNSGAVANLECYGAEVILLVPSSWDYSTGS